MAVRTMDSYVNYETVSDGSGTTTTTDGSLATETNLTNPIQEWIETSGWTREDVQIALTALSITLSAAAIYLSVSGGR